MVARRAVCLYGCSAKLPALQTKYKREVVMMKIIMSTSSCIYRHICLISGLPGFVMPDSVMKSITEAIKCTPL